ncbi:hypothetical protein CEK62_04990 [Alcanivorax sp. N3-2A]|nr:hypothetical protein CEK62_04990 [Alcanivorax sp. N3-2A]
MLGKLFKPRWQHRDPAVRAQAVHDLDAARDADTLTALARDDQSAEVRRLASAALLDFTVLDTLTDNDADAGVRAAAGERIMALLAGTVPGGPSTATRLHLIAHTNNPDVLSHVARHSPDAPCRQAALASLDDPQALYQLALSGKDEALRLAAAQRLEDATLLRQLSREGRDKRVVRLARERGKQHQLQEHQQREQQERVAQVCGALRQLAQRSSDPLFEARFAQLEQSWAELRDHASEPQRTEAEVAIGQCQTRLAEQAELARAEQARAAASREQRQAHDTLSALLRDTVEQTWEEQLGALRSLVDTQERRWLSASEEQTPTEDGQRAFQRQLDLWRQLIELAEAAREDLSDEQRRELAARWPSGVPAPASLSGLSEPQPEAPPARAPRPPQSRHRGLVTALRRELEKGNLKHANRLWHKAELALEEHDDAWLSAQLERLSARRDELRDWHSFAAQPKKEQLCERMEALEGAALDAAELASAIQALHDEWRELMSSDQGQDQALWDRFKGASDRAYQPCRAHSAELDQQRAGNLQRRRALCEQLAGFIDAQDWSARTGWQAVWEIRRQAPQEWKALSPVRFTDARDLQKRFSALLSQLDERLETAWQSAEQARQALIAEARELAAAEDVHGAARQAQTLQQAWRDTPWLPPARHRNHQKEFRRLMDALFAARQAQFDNRQAQRQEAAEQTRTRLQQVESALNGAPDDQDPGRLQRWADELGNADLGALDRDSQRRARQLIERLRRAAADLPRWRRWCQARERIAAAPAGPARPEDATLAVAIEALAGVDSPEHARAERMAWQLEQLPRAMKSSDFQPVEEALTLVEARADAQPLDADLAARLARALAALEPRP